MNPRYLILVLTLSLLGTNQLPEGLVFGSEHHQISAERKPPCPLHHNLSSNRGSNLSRIAFAKASFDLVDLRSEYILPQQSTISRSAPFQQGALGSPSPQSLRVKLQV
jgi:hypothetical protein